MYFARPFPISETLTRANFLEEAGVRRLSPDKAYYRRAPTVILDTWPFSAILEGAVTFLKLAADRQDRQPEHQSAARTREWGYASNRKGTLDRTPTRLLFFFSLSFVSCMSHGHARKGGLVVQHVEEPFFGLGAQVSISLRFASILLSYKEGTGKPKLDRRAVGTVIVAVRQRKREMVGTWVIGRFE